MNFLRDKQIRRYITFLGFISFFLISAGFFFTGYQNRMVKTISVSHDEAIASALLEQGISKEITASALTNTVKNEKGQKLLNELGMGEESESSLQPLPLEFQKKSLCVLTAGLLGFVLALFGGTIVFLRKRNQLYMQAIKITEKYADGDFSIHLPQNREGAVYQMFASVEQLAAMLRAKNDTEHKTKEFLKSTISDLSHQLKTPLAAMSMYQEIISDEPENTETVKEFSEKIGISLKRMEQLIQSVLKIARLDAGSILFEREFCPAADLVSRSVDEFTERAAKEKKNLVLSGDREQSVFCDPQWTSQALANLVKNALDHTKEGDTIEILWEDTPAGLRISVSDNGEGIAPEDIHHIFKRFYRSRRSLNTPGIGLGLSLAKAIIEGQDGMLGVSSRQKEGTTFTVFFLTES